ncbi:type III-B CRISPR module-associated protein Cmr5 [Pelagibius sp. Alg239-R121]|uniref:type III-B CRISPR module-associated protein Cmr5 n=1 Tax=Pelagibius sp. Alg239-R121 TaxID=2993448 RepID=UPI0024A61A6A|nr:type III-B CRISPR module-associated protein Cmr5 [Pelagibius sp. Alg239-R121]
MNREMIAQQRARKALERATERQKDEDLWSQYAVAVKGFPATILMNGLGQTFALALAGGGETAAGRLAVAADVYRWLSSWKDNPMSLPVHSGDRQAVIEMVKLLTNKATQQDYLILQAESLNFLTLLKTFAAGLSKTSESTEETSGGTNDPLESGARP